MVRFGLRFRFHLHSQMSNRMSIRNISIIVTDAIVECFDYHTTANVIFELITRRLWKLPDWLKWVILSRDVPMQINHEHQFFYKKFGTE